MTKFQSNLVHGIAGINEWESEGGALLPKPLTSLSDGIIAANSEHYRVDVCVYSNLEDAMAELGSQIAAQCD